MTAASCFWSMFTAGPAGDVTLIPGGSEPFRKAVERMGLDPERYQAVMWDVPAGAMR
jgi:hypothetical protein